MLIEYLDRPAFFPGVSNWLPGELVPANGGFVIRKPNNTILSVQPNGMFEERPAGTAGAWEVCKKDPSINVLRFNPDIPFAVIYRLR